MHKNVQGDYKVNTHFLIFIFRLSERMLSIEEQIAVVCEKLCGWTYQRVQEDFNCRFRKPGPNRKTINKLVNKFKRTGNVANAK